MAIIERKTSYGVRIHVGGGEFEWVGSFSFEEYGGKRAAKEAAGEAEREAKKARRRKQTTETCKTFATRWPDDYSIVKRGPTRGRQKSAKTVAVYRSALKQFIADFGQQPLAHVDRQQARKFTNNHSAKVSEVVRAMFADALEDGLIQANPFFGLQLPESPGRSNHAPLSSQELRDLADCALAEHGEKYGPIFRAYILAAGYIGFRLNEGLNLDWADVNFKAEEITLRVTKFDKPRTVWLAPQAADALRSIPRTVGADHVFSGKRGGRLTKGNHQSLWTPVRAMWWGKLTAERQGQLVDVDFHSLRHTCAHWIYIELGKGEELAAFQLGHSDPALIRQRYGHPFEGALERLKRGAGAPTIVPIRDANETHAAEGTA